MPGEVWVVVDRNGAGIADVALEIMGEARQLALKLCTKVCAIDMGYRLPGDSPALAGYGADEVFRVTHPLLANYTTDAYSLALNGLSRERQPSIVLFGATANGNDLAASLAAQLRVPIAADCIQLEVDDGGVLTATRPAYGDQVYLTLAFGGSRPWIATIRPGVIGIDRPAPSRTAEVIEVTPQVDDARLRTRFRRRFKPDPSSIPLGDADIVVAGGGGVGTRTGWSLIERLAAEIGASVGGSRVALDEGLISAERLVGQSGVTIAPSLCISIGISGATHHTQGMKDAKSVISINTDPAAPIFGISDLKVRADLHELLPVLTEQIRRAKGCRARLPAEDSG